MSDGTTDNKQPIDLIAEADRLRDRRANMLLDVQRLEALEAEYRRVADRKMTPMVRVGADFHSRFNEAEVVRVDFDTLEGEACVVVHRLASVGFTIVELITGAGETTRIGRFPWRENPNVIA